jgi:tetratricopeptide (TPR) repeat protein
MITMWLKGEQREVMIMGFEVTGEPQNQHGPKTAQLAADATLALHEKRPDEAEALLLQALELEPDAPGLKNNLALAYGLQGDKEKAEAMVRDVHREHPDYLFATLGVVRMHIRDGELDEAKALLDPLLQRKKFHTSEFSNLCQAQIEYWTKKGEQESARAWLDLWEQIDPEDPQLLQWQTRLNAPRWMRKLLNRR